MLHKNSYRYLLHNEITNDILQNIEDDCLDSLCDIFKDNWPYSVQVYYFLKHWIHLKRKNSDAGIRFTSPEGKWQDGTFLAIVTEFTYNIYFFTLEPSCERLCNALKQTKLIEWAKGPYICAIHQDQDIPVMKTLKTFQEIEFDIESTCWFLPKEGTTNFEIRCPENMYIAPLNKSHSTFINEIWPHKFPGSEFYIENYIIQYGGYGLFTKKDSKLCSWVMMNDFGAIAILQTIDKCKRRGYGVLLVKILAKKQAENGFDSITYIVRKNIVSQALFKSIGFRLVNNIRWVQYKRLENRIINSHL